MEKRPVTYTIPPALADPKLRFVRVTDPAEIEAIQRNAMCDPIGAEVEGQWWAEANSLAQFRKEDVEIEV